MSQRPPVVRRAAILALAVLLLALRGAAAGDWPQILGPTRSGRSADESLPASWPADGPPVLWSKSLGQGYAGPVVAGSRVVVFHRVGNNERVESFNAASGERQWSADFSALYRGGVNADTGPRCTPLIHQGAVYVFGAAGDLHCLDLATGDKRWSRSVYEEFNGDEGYFGAGSTPIVVDEKLLINVGGRSGAGIMAFSLSDGRTLWKATDEGASYSSPTTAVIDGQRQVIFATRLNTVAIDPKTGSVLYQFPFGRRGPTVNAATPLVFGNELFVSSSYGVGARLAKIGRDAAEVLWDRGDVMSSQYSTCVYDQGFLYGTHGREDIGRGELRCIEAKTGDVQWSQPDFGVAHVIAAGHRLLILNVEGRLVLANANPQRFDELARADVASDTTRALPALSGGRFFFRTNNSLGGKLICLRVAEGG